MKTHPILFSAPMVRAILEGRKTQTRRIINPQPPDGFVFGGRCICSTDKKEEGKAVFYDNTPNPTERHSVRCPFGEAGHTLWVRETWRAPQEFDGHPPKLLRRRISPDQVQYVADKQPQEAGKTRVAIHLPHGLHRITLTIRKIRVMRLQDISEEDAIAEGVDTSAFTTAKDGFRYLWNSIHGESSWNLNPWVWAIDFTP